jgi:Domain of unknown function (DUF4169)
MAEIINLRRARKAKTRAEQSAQADANRAAHGRTKAEKALISARLTLASSNLDGAKREDRQKDQ